MSEPNHTPGPWAWRDFGSGHALFGDHGDRPVVITALSTEPLRAVVGTRNDKGVLDPVTPDDPDARLIAQAPQMYEALRRLLWVMRRSSVIAAGYKEHKDEAIEMANDALQKANAEATHDQ